MVKGGSTSIRLPTSGQQLLRELFADNITVLVRVKIKSQQFHFLTVGNEGFDDVVADAFAAAIDVKVWVNYKESCQLNYASNVYGYSSFTLMKL